MSEIDAVNRKHDVNHNSILKNANSNGLNEKLDNLTLSEPTNHKVQCKLRDLI